jgi:hypothetical protein
MAIYFPNQNIQEISGKLNLTGGTIVQTIEVRSSAIFAAANWATQNEMFTGSITPTVAANKILVYIYAPFRMDVAVGNWSLAYMWVHNTTRNVNVITSGWNGTWRKTISSYEKQYLDSPGTTATQTYSFRVGNYPSGTCYWGNHPSNGNASDGYLYMRLQELSV